MKKLEAFIKPFKFEHVRSALARAGVEVVRVVEAREFGRESYSERYRGTEYEVDSVPCMLLIIVVEDRQAGDIVELIHRAASTGHPGDGRILVSSIEEIINIDVPT